MVRIRKCISIIWDKNKFVYGLALNRKGENLQIKDKAFCDKAELPFAERIKYVHDKLYVDEAQYVIIGGYFPSSVCFELDIPPLSSKNVELYLTNEIVRQIPFPIDKTYWYYKYLAGIKSEKENARIRIFALLSTEWNDLISEIMQSEIKIHSFTFPFMAANPPFHDKNIILSGIDSDFYLKQSVNAEIGFMNKINIESGKNNSLSENEFTPDYFGKQYKLYDIEHPENYLPALLLGEYCMTEQFLVDKKHQLPIPKQLRPKRFMIFKLISAILLIIFLATSTSYIIRNKIETLKVLDLLNDEQFLLTHKITDNRMEYDKFLKFEQVIDNIHELTLKPIKILDILAELSEKVPEDIWMTSFRFNNNKIDIILQTNNSKQNITSILNKSVLFSIENIRMNKIRHTTTQYIYLTLKPR